MNTFKAGVLASAVAWAMTAACPNANVLSACAHEDECPVQACDLAGKLSHKAEIYYPGSDAFTNATARWSSLTAPKVNIVVVPATENDVAETVKYANEEDMPFLAYNTAHGAISTLGKMSHGIEINMNKISSVKVAKDGKTLTIGGGTLSKDVTEKLWEAGKQTVTGTCECVGYAGPALGGGHGWLQGHYGLIADQFVEMNVVLADGSLRTLDAKSDLWWAMNGAGHNFGIVTSFTSKIYDIAHRDWAIETLIFDGSKVRELYEAANEHLLRNQPEGVVNWSYWLNIPSFDPENPVIIFYLIQEGVKAVDEAIAKPFRDIGPLVALPQSGDYRDLASWTEVALDSIVCQKSGLANARFPIYLKKYPVEAVEDSYKVFADEVRGSSALNGSIFLLEGYSVQGVHTIDSKSSAFGHRSENLLVAPVVIYKSASKALDDRAAKLGNQIRDLLHKGSGNRAMGSYINYAFGNEGPESWYGTEKWRQDRLRALKEKYDPEGRFSFYGPIA